MPTLKQPPDSKVTLGPPASSSHYYPEAASAHIYLAVVALAVLVAIRLASARLGSPQRAPRRASKSELQEVRDGFGPASRKDSAASYSTSDSAVHSPWEARDQKAPGGRLNFEHESRQTFWTAGLLPHRVGPQRFPPAIRPRAMDGIDEAQGKKDHSGSASAASRGVSTSNPSVAGPRHDQTPPLPGARPSPSGEVRRDGRASPSPSLASPSRRLSGSADGAYDKKSKGKGPMAGHSSWTTSAWSPTSGEGVSGTPVGDGSAVLGPAHHDGLAYRDPPASRQFSRPPPPPPLTPPAFSATVFPFEERRRSSAVSIPPELDATFIHLPNPDYAGDSTSTDAYGSSPRSTAGTPRRRSYTKSVPAGIPIPTATASSSTETMTSAETFSPSSYPPTSPLLPPPPPGHEFPYQYEFVGGPGGPGIVESEEQIDLHGEVISVTDDAGHGWKRHTRVYGGGVCLACAAAEQGGFYGDKVPLEDRR